MKNNQIFCPSKNIQLVTRWRDKKRNSLVTTVEETAIRDLLPGEILVKIIAVPAHGSFWLATHPRAIHPRIDEFMRDGYFVFGNGGVGQIIAVSTKRDNVKIGDYVSIFGHSPCSHKNCYSCRRLHRYVECDYGEGTIIGHGKGANDGTFAHYAILSEYSWEICFREEERPTMDQLLPFMFSFLVADVRNALTRNPAIFSKKRVILVGAGRSGFLAALLLISRNPKLKIFAVDINNEHNRIICSVAPDRIATAIIPFYSANPSSGKRVPSGYPGRKREEVIQNISNLARKHFGGRKCDLFLDFSSGDSSWLWDNDKILSPGTYCILFGFGISTLSLPKEVLQLSGLTLQFSRGVGNISNRRESIEFIKGSGGDLIRKYLIKDSLGISGLSGFVEYLDTVYNKLGVIGDIKEIYLIPN
jgi:threonine dehydrogenase-like Zn-dependent dehydrogenase